MTICTNCPEIVCANCAFIWVGGLLGCVGLPFMKLPKKNTKRKSGTEKVPQSTFATKISPNFRVNFLVRFASKTFVLVGNDR